MTRTLRLVALCVFTLLWCNINNLFAATYYVSPNGTNLWPNCTTQNSPCLADSTTTGKAFLGAVAGDTVYFLAGTYSPGTTGAYDHIAWQPSNSGNAGSGYITFKCLSGTCTLIHGGSSPSIGSNGKSYIIWDGFTEVSTGGTLVRFDGSINHVQLLNCDLKGYDSGGAGGNNAIVFVQTTDYVTIKNNKLHDSIGSENSDGLLFYLVSHATVENNEAYSNVNGLFDKVQGTYNTYRYNYCYNNSSMGIRISDEGNGHPSHIYVYQNVLRNNGFGIGLPSISAPSIRDYIYIYNNTSYNGKFYFGLGDFSNIEIFNNIIATGGSGFSYYVNTHYQNYNDIYNVTSVGTLWGSGVYSTLANWKTGTGLDTYSVNTNPDFVNPGGNLVTDYKRSSYPSNGRGGTYPSVMGAYITGNEMIGYRSLQGPYPPPPTGLIIISP